MRKTLSILSVLAAMSLAGCGDDTAGTGGMGGAGGAGGTAGRDGGGGTGGTGGMAGRDGGGGTGGIDAPMIDAALDGAMGEPDAAATVCMDYCDCMVNGNCQGSANGFTDVGQCQMACVNLTASQADCRAQQCNQSGDPASAECQHAVGMGAGAPAACR